MHGQQPLGQRSRRLVVRFRLPGISAAPQQLRKLATIEESALANASLSDFGMAGLLCEITHNKLYKFRGHKSFGEDVDANQQIFRFGIRRWQAYRLVRGLHVLHYLSSHRRPPASERQVSFSWL